MMGQLSGLENIGKFAENRATKKYRLKEEVPPYKEFFVEAFSVLEPGTRLKTNWHIDYLCDRFEEETHRIANKEPKDKDIIVNIMPRSLKSYIVTIMWNAWAWAVYPQLRFTTISYAYPLSVEHSSKTRDLIKSDWYQREFGEAFDLKKSQDSKNYFVNTKGGERKASSVGGQITGSGGNILVFDDPIKPPQMGEYAINETEIRAANDWHDSTAYNRINDPVVDLRVYVMQRLHNNDLTGHLIRKENQEYEHICIPGELTDDVKPEFLRDFYMPDEEFGGKKVFFKERFPKKVLLSYEENMLGNYPGQVLQTPQREGGGTWKEEYFRKISWDDLPQSKPIAKLTAWDLATNRKQRKNNSASAFVTGFKTKEGIFVTNCDYVWKEYPELLPFIKKQQDPHWIENKSSGKQAVPSLKAEGIEANEFENGNQDKFQNAAHAAALAKRLPVYVLDTIWDKLLTSKDQGICEFPAATWDDLHDAFCIFIMKMAEGMLSSEDIKNMISANQSMSQKTRTKRKSFGMTTGMRGGSFRGASI